MSNVDLNKPLVTCTLGDFISALTEIRVKEQPQSPQGTLPMPKLLKGIRGICEALNVSKYTATKIYHSGMLEGAIYHMGGTLFNIDPVKARELYQHTKL